MKYQEESQERHLENIVVMQGSHLSIQVGVGRVNEAKQKNNHCNIELNQSNHIYYYKLHELQKFGCNSPFKHFNPLPTGHRHHYILLGLWGTAVSSAMHQSI